MSTFVFHAILSPCIAFHSQHKCYYGVCRNRLVKLHIQKGAILFEPKL